MAWNDFFKTTTSLPEHWKTLNSTDELADAIALSEHQTVVLFKHSTRCPVSSMAKRELEGNFTLPKEKATFYYLDLIAHRDVSNAIAEKVGVHHESPQIIVLENGVATYSATHSGIQGKALEDAIG